MCSIRNRIFAFLGELIRGNSEEALALVPSSESADGKLWTPERLQQLLATYKASHGRIRLDPEARNVDRPDEKRLLAEVER